MGERNRVEWRWDGVDEVYRASVDRPSGRKWSAMVDAADWSWEVAEGVFAVASGTASCALDAKLAAEAALRKRGLLGEPRVATAIVTTRGTTGNRAMTPEERDAYIAPARGSYLDRVATLFGKQRTGDESDASLRGRCVATWAGVDMAIAPIRIPSPAWLTARGIFAGLATTMATPQGRRVLAVQAVDAAVADGARRGLDADALRVALVDDAEGPMRYGTAYTAHDAAHAVAAIECSPTSESAERYRRALAARSAKPLGRPQKRRWTTRREW